MTNQLQKTYQRPTCRAAVAPLILALDFLTAIVLLTTAVGLWALDSSAQSIPSLINYQGRLSDSNGAALPTSDYQLTFNIYDTTNAVTNLIWGPQIFDGTAGQGHGSKIPVVQGYFNVMLGPLDTSGRSLTDAFTNSPRFIEITVSNNSPIRPRQQILTAPFALNSAKLAGADWSAVFGTNDPVNGMIPTAKLATNGTIIAQQIGVGTGSPRARVEIQGPQTGDFLRLSRADAPQEYLNILGVPENGAGTGFSFQNRFFNGISYDTTLGLYLASAGSVAVGTTFPQGRFHVATAGEANALVVKTNGYVGIGTSNPTNKLHVIGGVSATAFVNTSDRNAKENFTAVSIGDVLAKVMALPITTWNFKDFQDGRHMGPMAQDFYATFGLGGSDTTITTIDPEGVALAAIQGLNQKLEEKLKEKDTEIEQLRAKAARIDSLEERLNALEQTANSKVTHR